MILGHRCEGTALLEAVGTARVVGACRQAVGLTRAAGARALLVVAARRVGPVLEVVAALVLLSTVAPEGVSEAPVVAAAVWAETVVGVLVEVPLALQGHGVWAVPLEVALKAASVADAGEGGV